jgi:uncharacterized protein YgfB (UPF0149 family)
LNNLLLESIQHGAEFFQKTDEFVDFIVKKHHLMNFGFVKTDKTYKGYIKEIVDDMNNNFLNRNR